MGALLLRPLPSQSFPTKLRVPPAGTIFVTNSGSRYRDTYLGLMDSRDGLLDSHLVALSRLNCRGGIFICPLALSNIHPFLTFLKAGGFKLTLLHEVESGRRRGLRTETSRGDIRLGLLFRGFRVFRTRVFWCWSVWFGDRASEGVRQVKEARVWSETQYQQKWPLQLETTGPT